jgi:uncharacterized protein YqjF (DUF2071 family)
MMQRSKKARIFLSAEWRDLVMLNYEIDPRQLRDFVPRGAELDSFGGRTLVSLVGFQFLRTKLFAVLPLPFHANFDEVNLRFYVRRRANGEERRGVVFIREIVPKRAVALLARLAYGENYSRYPMRHRVTSNGASKSVEYEWRLRSKRAPRSTASRAWEIRGRLHAEAAGEPAYPAEGSIDQFITEHYWGYSAYRDGGSVEYHVAHPRWRVWQSTRAGFEGNGVEIYGSAFGEVLRRPPDSAFIADGSPVVVFAGRRIE